MSDSDRQGPDSRGDTEAAALLRKILDGRGNVADWLVRSLVPRVAVRYGWDRPVHGPTQAIFEHHHGAQAAFVKRIARLAPRFADIPVTAPHAAPTPRWAVEHFPPLDSMAAYAMVEYVRPRRIVEIGVGDSTKVFRRAIDDVGLDCSLFGIDAKLRADALTILDKVKIKLLEELDPELFAEEVGPQLVFFDGTHRVLQNGDVATFFLDILPRLPAETVVGVHDIFLPRDYPVHLRYRLYGEQYLLAAYMIAQGKNFPLVFSCAYASTAFKAEIAAILAPEARDRLAERGQKLGGTTLWFRPPAWRKPGAGED